MQAMKSKALPRIGTALSVAFLCAVLWTSIFRDGWSLLVILLLGTAIVLYILAKLLYWAFKPETYSPRGLLIPVGALVSPVPMLILGSFLRGELLLVLLPSYQQTTEMLVNQTEGMDGTRITPTGALWGFVSESAIVDRREKGIATVWFFDRDSWAVHHSGIVYRSDDDVVALEKERPGTGFKRLKKCWYLWAH